MKNTLLSIILQPHRTIRSVVVFVMLLLSFNTQAQINVADAQSAATLAQKLAGQGVTVLNPVLRCPVQANGLFTVVSSNLGLDSGIVLTTGRAATIPGFYGVNGPSDGLSSFDNGVVGDSSLTVLAGHPTQDACKLEFDVVPAGDTVSINYVFGSEEYISAVCTTWNDAFAFFISGPGITGADNMALVPGTQIPVTINSINNGNPGPSGNIANCNSMGPGSPFTAYYIDNSAGTSITYKGFTTVLKAMHVVTPCDTYHFKIVIADAGNAKYDSGVFLEAGSLKTGDYKVNAIASPVYDSMAPICIKGCLPGRFRIKNPKTRAQPQVIRFTTAGTAISGVDYMPLADSVVIPAYATSADVLVYGIPTAANGTKTLMLTIYAPSICNSISYVADSASITIYDTLHITAAPADTTVCAGDKVQMHVTGDDIYNYNWTPVTALSNAEIKEPQAMPEVNTIYTVTAVMPGTSCPFRTATVNVTVRSTAFVDMVADTQVCYNTAFTLSPQVSPINSFYSYQWAGPNSFSSSLLSPTVPAGIAASGIYSLTVTNDTNGCRGDGRINVAIFVPPLPEVISPAYYCLNSQPIGLSASGNGLHWYTQGGAVTTSAPVPPLTDIGTYTYYVTDMVNDCESPKAEVLARVEKCCDGNIFIPTAFTPNGDGYNDVFRVHEDFSYSLKNMFIYNRWGQIVYSGNVGVWDGNAGLTPADGGVYYYKITFGCILGGTVEKTGDVTLIR